MKKLFFILFIGSLIGLVGCGQTVTSPTTESGEGEDATVNKEWVVEAEAEQKDKDIIVTIHITNQMEEAVTLDFTSGQKYEIVVVNEEGSEVYRFSNEMMFTMALTSESFEVGETKTYQETINADGWSTGNYTFYVDVTAAAINGEETSGDEQLKAQTELTIE
ncbi:BsuPI-related putative proteinase inhibitor [Alkalihalophilus lindianensis]|uniref:Intracellular proteinase inhibitor BsuPI domain-containing protein n=1 Tax=Alkalihalophilus lindianensis TaxID=1630542 RepID=A0ABU3XAT3_9BACI|nr:BsuPI-related putative proteinase inhibitor [Alkalihalophilus lindianensis]MDV2684994.1 BsuPI-related putative proteinase inhibitor [Alkalihalophilus lindianensis]